MQVVHDLRDDIRAHMPDRGPFDALIDRFQHGSATAAKIEEDIPLIGGRTTEEVLWACTTCGACQEVCPVFIDHPEKILQMRQNLVLVQEKVPADLARTFTNLERNGNPWGIGADKRMDWAEGLGVPTLDDRPDAEYLLWVGCAGAFDDRIKKQTRALVEVMREGGVDFAVLGPGGGLHRRSGAPRRQRDAVPDAGPAERRDDERQEGEEGRHRLPALPAHDQERVPAARRQLRGPPPHPADARAGRDRQDRSRRRRGALGPGGRPEITFHDPCYLGRWNGEYDAPRAVLDALAPGTRRPGRAAPQPRARASAAAPAAGGCGWRRRSGTRVNHNRTDEILATGAETVATACPFCTIMLTDGVKDRNAGERVQVLNVAELLAKSMKRKRELETAPAATTSQT